MLDVQINVHVNTNSKLTFAPATFQLLHRTFYFGRKYGKEVKKRVTAALELVQWIKKKALNLI